MSTVAEADRPREKLARVGAESLGDNELLALVLGSGTRSRGALIVADDVLRQAGGVRGLSRIDVDELCRVSGVGTSKASRVLAAVELGRRTLMSPSPRRRRLITTEDLVAHLLPRYSGFRDERFGVLLLDAKQRLMRTVILAQGSHEFTIALPARGLPGGGDGVGVKRGAVSQSPQRRSDTELRRPPRHRAPARGRGDHRDRCDRSHHPG
jgi:DNA repair protein RadC